MSNNAKQKPAAFTYDPESDILAWEVSGGAISYGMEMGNVIVHFGEGHAPALIEVLEATKLLGNAAAILEKMGIAVPKPMPAVPMVQRSVRAVTPEDFSE